MTVCDAALLGDDSRLPGVLAGTVRFLESSELNAMEGVPRDLREELVVAGRCSPVEARCDAGRPVAFCYADRTESLWDISIEMLEEYRRQGHATRCVVYMIQHLRPLRPIGAPEETNLASLRLTAKLGFVPVNKLPVFRALLRSSC